MAEEPQTAPPADELSAELSDHEKRANILRFAFANREEKLQEFCDIIRQAIPPGTRVVLRGSAVTGRRWADDAPFDADGPGTSDLDLTLVGDEAIKMFKLTGFFVPGIHSRPVSEDDPDIAPDLIPLRQRLIDFAGRPVNIQASRDIVLFLRGDVMGQAYYVLIERPDETASETADV